MAKKKITPATRIKLLERYIEENRPLSTSEWAELHKRMQEDPEFRLKVRTKARRKACLRQADEISDFINRNGYRLLLPQKDLDMFTSWASLLRDTANDPTSSLELLTEELNDCRNLLLTHMFQISEYLVNEKTK